MGNQRNKGNKKQKQKPGYFETNIKQYGEDFLEKKTARDISRDAQKVFRDIAFQNPQSMQNIARYFLVRQFVSNLALVAGENCNKRYATYLGLSTFYQTQGQNASNMGININQYLAEATNEYNTYSVILTGLNNIITVLNSGYDEQTMLYNITNILMTMSASLKQFKYNI